MAKATNTENNFPVPPGFELGTFAFQVERSTDYATRDDIEFQPKIFEGICVESVRGILSSGL